MQVVLSVAAGKISPVTLRRRLSTHSRRNKLLHSVPRGREGHPAKLEHRVKFSTLLANAGIFHTTLHTIDGLRQLAVEGWEIKPEDLGCCRRA